VICSERRIPKVSRAAAFWTDWSRRIKLTGNPATADKLVIMLRDLCLE